MTEPAQDLVLTMERTFAASPDRVYRAWTDEDEVVRWIAPSPEMPTTAELDVREGGRYTITMGSYVVRGVYRELAPGRKLVFTWRWDGESDHEMLVTVAFEATSSNGTRMRLEHVRLPTAEQKANHEQGWTGSFARLEGYLGATD
ncbi:MAG: SRPBCC domain-containing protein [Trueperaceae bacterium]